MAVNIKSWVSSRWEAGRPSIHRACRPVSVDSENFHASSAPLKRRRIRTGSCTRHCFGDAYNHSHWKQPPRLEYSNKISKERALMTFEKIELASGRAVLYRGDSLSILNEIHPVDAVITDPPYSSGGLHRSNRGLPPSRNNVGEAAMSAADLYVRNEPEPESGSRCTPIALQA